MANAPHCPVQDGKLLEALSVRIQPVGRMCCLLFQDGRIRSAALEWRVSQSQKPAENSVSVLIVTNTAA